MGQQSAVKKIRPYPFPCTLTFLKKTCQGSIIKLTQFGFLVEIPTAMLQVGERGMVAFSVPLGTVAVQANVVVVHTWDRFGTPINSGAAGQKIAEVHFQGMPLAMSDEVNRFLRQIGQIR